jgi:rhomboid protease GluP
VVGRRFGLLAAAGKQVREAAPLDGDTLAARAEAMIARHEQGRRFSMALQARTPWATRLFCLACLLYFVLSRYWGAQGFEQTLVRMGANGAAWVLEAHQFWRLFSHAFLHGGEAHLMMNLIALYSFGGFLESLLGWRRLVILYGLSALGGGLASVAAGIELSVGASGAIWGLMTAGLGLVLGRKRVLPAFIASRLRPQLLLVLTINGLFSVLPLLLSAFPRIDLYAHAGGGLVGFALTASGLLMHGIRPLEDEADGAAADGPASARRDSGAWRLGAVLILVALGASLLLALSWGRPWQSLEELAIRSGL